MMAVSPELIKPIVLKYQEEAVNTVLTSSLPEDVKRDLAERLRNYWFNVDEVVDYVNFVISLLEKVKLDKVFISFSPFIEEDETFKQYEWVYEAYGNEEALNELCSIVTRLDRIARDMYHEIFRKLGYEVERHPKDPWKLIVRKP